MTSQIFPGPGEVWTCDFSGYVKPEIVKRRRVIVVSPRNPGARIVLVVPVSTIAPNSPRSVHVRFPPNSYRCFGDVPTWAKADLLAHVRLDRLRQWSETGVDQVVASIDGLTCGIIVYVLKTPSGGDTIDELISSAPPRVARSVDAFSKLPVRAHRLSA